MKNVRVHPAPTLRGEIQVPGDKSVSHRAVMLSALSEGVSTLRGLLMGEDVLSTIGCFRELGVQVDIFPDRVVVQGVGLRGLKPPQKVLDCGNSGTTMRLMMGILAGQPFESRLTGDASLNRRPMERVAKPLREMGAQIEEFRASETERVVKVTGRPLRGIHYKLPVASAQIKSAILLAGLYASGETGVEEGTASRDHSERMLRHKGVALEISGGLIRLRSGQSLKAEDLEIPGDISSAAFFLVGGAIGSGSEILLKNVGINPTRTGVLEVLQAMGTPFETLNPREIGGEPVADLRVRSAPLRAARISGALIPRLIDEIPILCIAAAAAQGTTEVRDAEELRVKETDRIAAMERELAKLGVKARGVSDGIDVTGPANFQAGDFESGTDHRVAMSMAVAATRAPRPSRVLDVDCVQTSYPNFFDQLQSLGAKVEFEG
ncbi:3-phosphoshikimate 1-carboxyvinyltransferase [Deltaproteobacteria bacterium PRO3]|nr:3-phosphoshikimate 1-carboxyvinyltransferase [Deltaproteobacteria bacterium PRO3]